MTTVLNYSLIALLFLAWVGLFAVKDASRQAAGEAADLERQIRAEEERVQMLMTDWAIVNEPGYLQALAQTHLGMRSLATNQIVTMSALPPVPIGEDRAPRTGTFLATARGYQQFPPTRGTAIPRAEPADEFAGWARPRLRPAQER